MVLKVSILADFNAKRELIKRKVAVQRAQADCINSMLQQAAQLLMQFSASERAEYNAMVRDGVRIESISARGVRRGGVGVLAVQGAEELADLLLGDTVYPPDYVAVRVAAGTLAGLTQVGLGARGDGYPSGEEYYLNVPPGQESEFNGVHAGLYLQLPRTQRNNQLQLLASYHRRVDIQQALADVIRPGVLEQCVQQKLNRR